MPRPCRCIANGVAARCHALGNAPPSRISALPMLGKACFWAEALARPHQGLATHCKAWQRLLRNVMHRQRICHGIGGVWQRARECIVEALGSAAPRPWQRVVAACQAIATALVMHCHELLRMSQTCTAARGIGRLRVDCARDGTGLCGIVGGVWARAGVIRNRVAARGTARTYTGVARHC